VSSTGAVCPLASGSRSGSFVGKPAGLGEVNGEKMGRIANAYTKSSATAGLLVGLVTYPSTRDLPIDSEVFPTRSDDVGIPCTAADLGVLIVRLCFLAVDMAVL